MLKYIIKKYYEGGISAFLAGLAIFFILMGEIGIGFVSSIYICIGLEKVLGKGLITNIIFGASSLILMLSPMLRFSKLDDKYGKNKRTGNSGNSNTGTAYDSTSYTNQFSGNGNIHLDYLSPSELRIVMGDEEIPYFRDLLEESQIEYLLKKEKFHNYKYRTNTIAEYVQISEDGKWLRLGKNILPLDFICGYSKHNNELYTIDGAVLVLPEEARDHEKSREIGNFFEERGMYFKTTPHPGRYEFRRIVEKCHTELSKADWSRIRYNWEKAYANSKEGRSRKGNLQSDVFTRVLPTDEILKATKKIKDKRKKISDYIDFSKFRNEYSVCNGIEILTMLGYPANSEGIDFLFECLRDVDEAYFLLAINALKTIPLDALKEKIEENAKLAYEAENVERLAGVMYLAKEIGYEIEFTKELKEKAVAREKEEKNKIPAFTIDERLAYASDRIQKFNPDSLAYAYQED